MHSPYNALGNFKKLLLPEDAALWAHSLVECEPSFSFYSARSLCASPKYPALSGNPGTHPLDSKFHEDTVHVSLIREASVPSERPGAV